MYIGETKGNGNNWRWTEIKNKINEQKVKIHNINNNREENQRKE